MCTDQPPAGHRGSHQILHDGALPVQFDLEPVDSVTVTTLMDNVTDVFMPEQGPARRAPVDIGGRRPASTMESGDAPEALLAEHGFSVLVTVTKNVRPHPLPFHPPPTPSPPRPQLRPLHTNPPH